MKLEGSKSSPPVKRTVIQVTADSMFDTEDAAIKFVEGLAKKFAEGELTEEEVYCRKREFAASAARKKPAVKRRAGEVKENKENRRKIGMLKIMGDYVNLTVKGGDKQRLD